MTDPFTTYDAAYLLGALSPEDRRAFEAHLRECDACSRAVADLSGLPGLLGKAPLPDPRHDPGPVPETVLPGLLAEVARRRARRHRLSWLAAAAVAAVAAVSAILVGLPDSREAPEPGGVPMSAVAANTPVRADAVLDSRPWGTHIRLHCSYDAAAGYRSGTYRLVVTDTDGATQRLGTWTVVPGETSTVDGSTSLDLDQIASIEVRTLADTTVLALEP